MPVSTLPRPALAGPPRVERAAPVRLAFRAQLAGEEAVRHRRWRVAQDGILAALTAPGVVVLAGPHGVGKSLMLDAIAHLLRAAGRDAALLCGVSGLDAATGAKGGAGAQIVLVDDADELDDARLAALARPGPHCVLAGSPALAARLRAMSCPITLVALAPLDPSDVRAFLAEQLDLAGQPPDLLEPAAVAALAERSGGVPRALQLLAGLSVFMARLEDAPRVGAAHVALAGAVGDETDLRGALPDSDETDAAGEDGIDLADAEADEPGDSERDGRETVWSPPAQSTARQRSHRRGLLAMPVVALLALGIGLVTARTVGDGATAPPAPVVPAVLAPAPALPPAPVPRPRSVLPPSVVQEAAAEKRADFEAALRNRRGFVPVPVLRETLDDGRAPADPAP